MSSTSPYSRPQGPLTTSSATVYTDGGSTILAPDSPHQPVDWLRQAKGAAWGLVWGLATLTILALYPYAREGGFGGDEPQFMVATIALGVGTVWMASSWNFGPVMVLVPAVVGFVLTAATNGAGLLHLWPGGRYLSPGEQVASDWGSTGALAVQFVVLLFVALGIAIARLLRDRRGTGTRGRAARVALGAGASVAAILLAWAAHWVLAGDTERYVDLGAPAFAITGEAILAGVLLGLAALLGVVTAWAPTIAALSLVFVWAAGLAYDVPDSLQRLWLVATTSITTLSAVLLALAAVATVSAGMPRPKRRAATSRRESKEQARRWTA